MAANMSERRIRSKLRNEYPTNKRQLKRILETQTDDELRGHCRKLDVGGYRGVTGKRLVKLLVNKWKEYG